MEQRVQDTVFLIAVFVLLLVGKDVERELVQMAKPIGLIVILLAKTQTTLATTRLLATGRHQTAMPVALTWVTRLVGVQLPAIVAEAIAVARRPLLVLVMLVAEWFAAAPAATVILTAAIVWLVPVPAIYLHLLQHYPVLKLVQPHRFFLILLMGQLIFIPRA